MKNNHGMCRAIIFITITFLTACTVTQAPSHYRADVIYPDAPPPPLITYSAPPPLQPEVMGAAPVPGYFWIPGVWIWEDNRHVWHPGRWSAPRPGYIWVPHRWYQEGREWRMDGGHWVRNH